MPRAVLFDMFGTLLPGGSRAERDAVTGAMAADLGVGAADLAAVWATTYDERARGLLGDLDETLAFLARRLGADPTPDARAWAAARRLEFTASLHRRTWALPALTALAEVGVPMGLVTDCTIETPMVWDAGPLAGFFGAVSMSCVTGVRKPEPEAYLRATGVLGVDPGECLFVGDGGSHELSGAASLGMTVRRYSSPHSGDRVDPDTWDGPQIGDLLGVLDLL